MCQSVSLWMKVCHCVLKCVNYVEAEKMKRVILETDNIDIVRVEILLSLSKDIRNIVSEAIFSTAQEKFLGILGDCVDEVNRDEGSHGYYS